MVRQEPPSAGPLDDEIGGMRRVGERAVHGIGDQLPLDQRISGVIAPMVAFHVKNPAAKVLLTGAEISPDLASAMQALQDATLARVGELIIPHPPVLSAAERRRVGRVCVQIFNGILDLILRARKPDRPALVAELERVLVAYLSAIGTDAPDAGPPRR